ncbi:hypothetical protein U0070_018846 [Myodes glareolus]|uniref:Uncharacterized protein n=1 Tax=Myodes glareolus TaxID=447135 RepID=A0AAW0JU87_MYOGA
MSKNNLPNVATKAADKGLYYPSGDAKPPATQPVDNGYRIATWISSRLPELKDEAVAPPDGAINPLLTPPVLSKFLEENQISADHGGLCDGKTQLH